MPLGEVLPTAWRNAAEVDMAALEDAVTSASEPCDEHAHSKPISNAVDTLQPVCCTQHARPEWLDLRRACRSRWRIEALNALALLHPPEPPPRQWSAPRGQACAWLYRSSAVAGPNRGDARSACSRCDPRSRFHY